MKTLLLALTLSQDPQALQPQELEGFAKAMSVFLQDYFGCPRGALEYQKDVCTAPSSFNYKAWKESRERAKRLFGLEEKKGKAKNERYMGALK